MLNAQLDQWLIYSSGEEDEIREFSYRAKLFRFDKDANQWKEKGLGEMKILRHKETGQLIIRGSYMCACFFLVLNKLRSFGKLCQALYHFFTQV